MNLLSIMTFFPLVGMLIVLFLPREADRLIKSVTLIITIITFVIVLVVLRLVAWRLLAALAANRLAGL